MPHTLPAPTGGMKQARNTVFTARHGPYIARKKQDTERSLYDSLDKAEQQSRITSNAKLFGLFMYSVSVLFLCYCPPCYLPRPTHHAHRANVQCSSLAYISGCLNSSLTSFAGVRALTPPNLGGSVNIRFPEIQHACLNVPTSPCPDQWLRHFSA